MVANRTNLWGFLTDDDVATVRALPDNVAILREYTFLLNVIRDELPIGEVPIRLWFRKRESDDATDEIDAKRLS